MILIFNSIGCQGRPTYRLHEKKFHHAKCNGSRVIALAKKQRRKDISIANWGIGARAAPDFQLFYASSHFKAEQTMTFELFSCSISNRMPGAAYYGTTVLQLSFHKLHNFFLSPLKLLHFWRATAICCSTSITRCVVCLSVCLSSVTDVLRLNARS